MRLLLPAIFLMLYITHANSQKNLIDNGGFEQHNEIRCIDCDLYYGAYPGFVYAWDNLGTGGVLYDVRHPYKPHERFTGAKADIQPCQGNAMVGLIYTPDCGKIGCMDMMCSKTTETMQVGNLYEISFWLYIQSGAQQDTNWARHIGIAMLPQKVKNDYKLEVPFLHIDTVKYDQWYPVKWKVRPLCNASFLLIGTFRNEAWPVSRSFKASFFYIDRVGVVQLPDPDGGVQPDSSTYYCSQYDPAVNPQLRPDMERLQLYFETASAALSPTSMAALDKLALFAQRYPGLVIEISGHTDSIGTENQTLAQNRVQATANYLQAKHGIPAHRMIQCGFGSKRPIAPNQTAAGRVLNRRVEIRVSDLTLPQAYYRQALATQEVPDKFVFLHKWQQQEARINGHALMLDPRFDQFKKDKRWLSLQQQLRDAYNSLKYPRQAFLMDSLFMDDELTSGALTRSLNYLSGYTPGIDTVYFDGLPEYDEQVIQAKGRERYQRGFQPILKQVGWPTQRVFGEDTQNAAFFLLFHSDDPTAIATWLPSIKTACEAGATPWIMYAKLYDHCQVLQQQKQRYGTETMNIDGKTYVQPCEGDREAVNRLRAQWNLGLVPDGYILF